tara:strand:+ start:69 stop:374 length:306 start_codon:yes stop_codon:yes gene_type:complete
MTTQLKFSDTTVQKVKSNLLTKKYNLNTSEDLYLVIDFAKKASELGLEEDLVSVIREEIMNPVYVEVETIESWEDEIPEGIEIVEGEGGLPEIITTEIPWS